MNRLLVWTVFGFAGLVAISSAPADTVRVKNQKTLVVIYRGEPDAENRMSDEALEQCKNGIELGRLFYWRNSGARFNVELDWMVIDTTAPENAGPTFEHMEADLKARGVKPGDYDGAIVTGVGMAGNWGGFNILDGTAACFGGGGTGGGLTSYPEDDPDTGYAWGWIFVHEYQHAVDLVTANEAGREDFLHAHPYTDRTMPFFKGNYQGGEHWDWIALTFREFDGWMDLKGVRNEFLECTDNDADGLPDDDPRLAMDEIRYGSDPADPDTDDDGLNDLGEFTAGRYEGSNPQDPDTDNDGLRDGEDPYPLIAIAPTIGYRVDDASPLGKLIDSVFVRNDEGGAVAAYAGWAEDGLALRFSGPRPFGVHLKLDGSADNGFWEGGDTYLIRITDSAVTFAGLGLDGQVPGATSCGAETKYGYELEAFIPARIGQGVSKEINYGGEREPQDVTDGLTLVHGRPVGFNIIYEFADGQRAVLTPHHTMFATRLVKPADAPDRPLLRSAGVSADPIPTVDVLGIRADTPVEILAGDRVVGMGIGSGRVLLTGIDDDGEYGLRAKVGEYTSDEVALRVDRTAEPPEMSAEGGVLRATCEPGAEFELWWGRKGLPVAPLSGAHTDDAGRVEIAVDDALEQGWVATAYRGTDFAVPAFVERWDVIDRNFRGGRADDRLPPDDFGYRFEGILMVEAAGPYRFELSSDDGSRLYLDGSLLIDHWGHHGSSGKTSTVVLEAGPHPVRVDYYEEDGWAGIHVQAAAEGEELGPKLPVRTLLPSIDDVGLFGVQVDPLGNRSGFSGPVTP